METRIIRKTIYASKGPEVTLRNIWDDQELRHFCAILGKSRAKLQMWDFNPIPSESRSWPNVDLQARAVQQRKSHHDDNILSEKAAKKSHDASNCELHKTKFKQLISDAYMTFQGI